jgi:ParB family transcriptional regulator, chromosome partitioning protein
MMMIQAIPLAKLVPSRRNVRRQTDAAADLQLKADIAARGLLQNLVVTSAAKPKGSFAVEAGGRRLAALKTLAADGVLPKSFEVPCLVLDGTDARALEASLAENFQRLAMNPADECLAFEHLINQGATVEGVATRFGLTTRFVEGRLRLAGLAPVVFEALGRGDITLDAAKAYAVTPDRERQTLVYDQVSRGYGAIHPDSIRRMMTQATLSAADPRARFVGEDAYVAAGGRIERDLFADDASTRWLDIAVVERLATEKMAEAAATLRAELGLAWVKPLLDEHVRWEQTESLVRLHPEQPPLSDEETAECERLQAETDDLAALIENEDATDAQRADAEARLEKIERRIDAIMSKPPLLDDQARPGAGTFLVLARDGTPRPCGHYYAERAAPTNEHDDAAGFAEAIGGTGAKASSFSQRLLDELAMQRRDLLAVHVAADPEFALDLAIFVMASQQSGYVCERIGSSIRAPQPQDPAPGFKTPGAPASIEQNRMLEALDRSWLEGGTLGERFDAFRRLAPQARAAWLGVLVAGTLEASLNRPGGLACAFHDHLGQLLGIDPAAWWRPTAPLFFDRVSKPVMFEALTMIGGPTLASRYSMAKKADLAATCERIFSGDHILEADVKQAAIAWVPEIMRFGARTADAVDASDCEGKAAGSTEFKDEPELEPDRVAA